MVLLLRLGELTIKSHRTRRRFESLLVRNLRNALAAEGLGGSRVRLEGGRVFVYAPDEERALEVLRRVFGVKSLSRAVEVEFEDLGDLVAKAESYFAERVRGRRFAVRARRVGSHGFTSKDVERELGAALLKHAAGVDLENPEVTAYVEVRGRRAYLFTDIVKAYGGLPVGSEGRVLALVSGGFDSAVAAWFMLRRGAEVHYLLCNLGGPIQEAGVLHVLKVLAERWSYGYRPKLYVVDFGEVLKEIRRKCDPSLLTVILKRFMLRAAEALSRRKGFEAVVTGDSLGQASSQTLTNLAVTSAAVRAMILRPLVGLDKDDIVALAREIGTYEASERVKEFCGAFAERPRTRASLEEVEREESKVSPEVLERALANLKVYDLKSVRVEEGLYSDLEVDSPPEGSVVIDLRSEKKAGSWRIPGALRVSFDQLIEGAAGLDPSKTYVLVCEEGALSLEAAYVLRKLGYKAYSLKGGARRAGKAAQGGGAASSAHPSRESPGGGPAGT